jgi:hypothetical protein
MKHLSSQRRTCARGLIPKILSLTFLLLAIGGAGASAAEEFVLRLPDAAAVKKVWGDVRSYPEPRGLMGRDESHPAHRRGPSVGAFSNAIFDVGPFVMPAQPLRINLDTLRGETALTHQAYAMVEVLDRSGNVLPSYARESCLLIDVNELDRTLAWNGRDTTSLTGQEVTLRIHTRDARVYAVHTAPLPGGQIPRSLRLEPVRSELPAWDTMSVTLHGRTSTDRFLSLDRADIRFEIEPADAPVQVKSDKRDRHTAYVTVTGDVPSARSVRVRARAKIAGGELESPAVTLRLLPARPATDEKRIVQVFMQPSDLTAQEGPVKFQANTIMPYAESRGLPVTEKAMTVFGRRIGDRYHVWGSSRKEGGLYRAETRDGLNYENLRPLVSDMAPEHLMSMIYNPRADRYLAFERGIRPVRWYGHFSSDGITFSRAQTDPLFKDHDAAHLVWDEERRRYILVSLTYQLLPEPRRLTDNLAWEPVLGRRGVRRVISTRTSPDGIKWTPGQNVVGREPATWLREDQLIVPDAQDPVDMEHYWFLAFRHHDRWLGIVLTYAPSPLNVLERVPYDPAPSKHGPHLGTEWWVSTDGVKWDRPWRDTPATHDWRIYFSHDPMRLHDRMLFLTSNQLYNLPPLSGARPGQHQEVYSLPADRIASTGSDAPATFTSRPFAMPAGGLYLNYEHTGTLAVELLDESGRVLSGYTRADGAIPTGSMLAAPLRWAGRTGAEVAGRTVRVRFHTAKARVYALYQ